MSRLIRATFRADGHDCDRYVSTLLSGPRFSQAFSNSDGVHKPEADGAKTRPYVCPVVSFSCDSGERLAPATTTTALTWSWPELASPSLAWCQDPPASSVFGGVPCLSAGHRSWGRLVVSIAQHTFDCATHFHTQPCQRLRYI